MRGRALSRFTGRSRFWTASKRECISSAALARAMRSSSKMARLGRTFATGSESSPPGTEASVAPKYFFSRSPGGQEIPVLAGRFQIPVDPLVHEDVRFSAQIGLQIRCKQRLEMVADPSRPKELAAIADENVLRIAHGCVERPRLNQRAGQLNRPWGASRPNYRLGRNLQRIRRARRAIGCAASWGGNPGVGAVSGAC